MKKKWVGGIVFDRVMVIEVNEPEHPPEVRPMQKSTIVIAIIVALAIGLIFAYTLTGLATP